MKPPSMKTQGLELSTLSAVNGLQVQLLNYGASLAGIRVPLGSGSCEVVLSYPEPADYLLDTCYLGSTIGRYAGRIRAGRLPVLGRTHQLQTGGSSNEPCLHGGPDGFHSRYWRGAMVRKNVSVRYHYQSPDGEAGFPGQLDAQVSYSLPQPMQLLIEFQARADQATVVNMTNHAYFNLAMNSGSIYGQYISIDADAYAPNDARGLPTGEVREVAGGAFDLRRPTELVQDFDTLDAQLLAAGGYDHYFFGNHPGDMAQPAATLHSPATGLKIRFFTSHSGVQFYTGNFLAGRFQRHGALCLEFQDAPDAPNIPGFPYCLLQAGEYYRRETLLDFTTEK
jgi:aldose 1-epimerase